MADYRGLRKTFFSLFSLLIPLICFALYLSFHKVELNFFLYLLLAIIHQQAMLFYNSLLKIFETKGTASGFGVALGYVGSAIALILFAPRLSLPTAFRREIKDMSYTSVKDGLMETYEIYQRVKAAGELVLPQQ